MTATVGVYLMLATFATLILLVHHVSTMLQAPNIAASAGAELLEVIGAANTEDAVRGDDAVGSIRSGRNGRGAAGALAETDSYAVHVSNAGYIQYIDPSIMRTLCLDHIGDGLVAFIRHGEERSHY